MLKTGENITVAYQNNNAVIYVITITALFYKVYRYSAVGNYRLSRWSNCDFLCLFMHFISAFQCVSVYSQSGHGPAPLVNVKTPPCCSMLLPMLLPTNNPKERISLYSVIVYP